MTLDLLPVVAPGAHVLTEHVKPPERLSATTLMAAERCLLAAYLARQTGDPAGEPALLGQAFHDIAAQVGFMARLQQQEVFTPDEAERVAWRVLERPVEHRPLSREHMRDVIWMVRKWALTAAFPVTYPVYDVEVTVRHMLAGEMLSGRIDLLAIDGTTAIIEDYKTGQTKPPTQDEVEKDHPQLPTYAWHVQQDHPEVETFVLRERYVRSGEPREVIRTAEQIRVHARWLEVTAKRLRQAWAVNAFPATPGRHCRWCPNPTACPLPEIARPESIDTSEQAQAQLAAILVEEARLKLRKKALRAYLLRDDVLHVTAGDADAYVERVPGTRLDRKAAAAAGVDLSQFEKPTESQRMTIESVT